ncbi:MAG: hypothetical protein QG650_926 [Patescibacteria group bacterium]|nr:hypothetical protein [Patescibacteria group bacterium]
MKNTIKHAILFGITSFLTILACTVAYAAWTNLADVSASSPLTAALWNSLVAKVNDIGGRTDGIYSTGGKIGVATNAPTEELEVNGNVKATPIFGQWQHGGHQYTTSTATTVLLQTENVNTNPEYFELLADQSGVLVKKAGYYYFEGSTDAMTSAYTGRFDMMLKSSAGANVAYGIHMIRSAGTNTYTNYAVSGMSYVAANTTISMRLETASAADWFIHSGLASMRIYKMN